MILKFTLLNHLLLVSAALAVPLSQLEGRIARRHENDHQLQAKQPAADAHSRDIEYYPNMSGGLKSLYIKAFTTITGTFTIPTIKPPIPSNGDILAVVVTFDGYADCRNFVQAGAYFNGTKAAWIVWYEWSRQLTVMLDGFPANPGQNITATLTASSPTDVMVYLRNENTGTIWSEPITSKNYPLCLETVAWMVVNQQANSPLPNFGNVTFTGASATGPNTDLTPWGSDLIVMARGSTSLTLVQTRPGTVFVKYLRS